MNSAAPACVFGGIRAKAYDADRIRATIQGLGATPVIPPRSGRARVLTYDRHLYKERHLIECFISALIDVQPLRGVPIDVLGYSEADLVGLFPAGKAVFLRSWSPLFAETQDPESPVGGKVGVTVLPKGGSGGRHAATLGGWMLAVSRHSSNPDLAVDLVSFLSGREEQKRRALEYGFNPSVAALYRDPEVLSAAPHFDTLYDTLTTAVVRPSAVTGQRYDEVSEALWEPIYEVLDRRVSATQRLAERNGSWIMSRNGREW